MVAVGGRGSLPHSRVARRRRSAVCLPEDLSDAGDGGPAGPVTGPETAGEQPRDTNRSWRFRPRRESLAADVTAVNDPSDRVNGQRRCPGDRHPRPVASPSGLVRPTRQSGDGRWRGRPAAMTDTNPRAPCQSGPPHGPDGPISSEWAARRPGSPGRRARSGDCGRSPTRESVGGPAPGSAGPHPGAAVRGQIQPICAALGAATPRPDGRGVAGGAGRDAVRPSRPPGTGWPRGQLRRRPRHRHRHRPGTG